MPDDGISEEVSKEKLERELQGIENAIGEMEERIKDLEDRDMMAELETMSFEEEVKEVEEMLNHMDKEELEKRLSMVEQIKEEYQEGKVHEKLEYLYRQIKELKQQKKGSIDDQRIERLEEKIEELEKEIDRLKHMRASSQDQSSELSQVITSSKRFEIQDTGEGQVVKLR